ncbi:MAG: metalloregulator ArsR/SmtB family transcription factor [Sulfuricurvum sp.]|uniref:ArsR/SmtB family transcription factor n=1 Tax=Sulfuricurvum sp. TaxID=2025608 RepID=UPI00261FA5E6|nr:metalloregulator ArsR/SmtB family transcription factor [Sulfuricurvum sp.]MDD5159903.1 metalloregulator ArsR/SmtB family transcription factor [Sulfuricurvum sp.]
MKTNYTDVLPPEWKPMSDIFTALGDEHRQRMLMLFEPDERLTAGQISDASTLARTTVSHHLKILRQAEVLLSEKKGKEVWFWINKPLLEKTFGNVLTYLQGKTND